MRPCLLGPWHRALAPRQGGGPARCAPITLVRCSLPPSPLRRSSMISAHYRPDAHHGAGPARGPHCALRGGGGTGAQPRGIAAGGRPAAGPRRLGAAPPADRARPTGRVRRRPRSGRARIHGPEVPEPESGPRAGTGSNRPGVVHRPAASGPCGRHAPVRPASGPNARRRTRVCLRGARVRPSTRSALPPGDPADLKNPSERPLISAE